MTITVQSPVLSDGVRYSDRSDPVGARRMRICKIPVSFNGTITEAVAHCVSVDGNPVEDDAPLKWANHPDYKRPLVGGMTVGLGLFELHNEEPGTPGGLYLHTVSDTYPKKPVTSEPGEHVLKFRIDSQDHCMTFSVKVFVGSQVSLGG